MRILDDESDKKLDSVQIFLTQEEAMQLKTYLVNLIENPKLHHSHLSSCDYKKEITICLYDEKNLKPFNQRALKLIKEDK